MTELFNEQDDTSGSQKVVLVETITELPDLLLDLLSNTQCLRALRVAAPYPTAANVQTRFRQEISSRLLAGSLEVQRIEIFYGLDRIREALYNVLRYSNQHYHLKAYCPGIVDVVPAIGAYMFDDSHFLMGGYWTGIPPHGKPGLCCSGEPFRTFFLAYWAEIWSNGILLNIGGPHDLSAIRRVAVALGLDEAKWPEFVEQARVLEIGDDAPPLI